MTRGRSSSGDPQALSQQQALLKLVAEGSPGALDRLLAAHRQELLDYVRLRLSRQLSARLDPSDVVQEVQLTVAQRIDDYLQADYFALIGDAPGGNTPSYDGVRHQGRVQFQLYF